MCPASWIPLDLPGIGPAPRPLTLTDDEFRLVIKLGIQKLFVWVCFEEIRAVTGPGSLKATLTKLGIEVRSASELQAWRARLRGARFPRPDVIKQIKEQLPRLRFDLSHPMIKWLAVPDLDERTVRRLQAQMPPVWHDVVAEIKTLPMACLQVSPKLFERLRLERLGYLDALFAFARARTSALCDDERRKALSRVLWTLPILYPDDPIWTAGTRQDRHVVMACIDYALGLHGPNDPGSEWLGSDRMSCIGHQHWRVDEWVSVHPHALRTTLIKRRFWAKTWRWRGNRS